MTQLSGTLDQYDGRTVDFLAFEDMKASGDTQLTQALVLAGQTGALITGIEKLVQRFLLELLTERGSLHYDLQRGTFFITKIRAGIVNTSQALFAVFNAAELELRNTLKMEEDKLNEPADECYKQATLLSASLLGDFATLSIQVQSMAEESRTIIYPLRVIAN
jgi:hypothetical protein